MLVVINLQTQFEAHFGLSFTTKDAFSTLLDMDINVDDIYRKHLRAVKSLTECDNKLRCNLVSKFNADNKTLYLFTDIKQRFTIFCLPHEQRAISLISTAQTMTINYEMKYTDFENRETITLNSKAINSYHAKQQIAASHNIDVHLLSLNTKHFELPVAKNAHWVINK